MRVVVTMGILALASPAMAERVFFDEGELRDRVLDKLVASKQLDARNRASFPTRKQAERALAKLPAANTKMKKPIDVMRCGLISGNGDLVFTCTERGCAGSCRVIRNEVTIRVRSGTWSVIGTDVKRLGDTGECGCCM